MQNWGILKLSSVPKSLLKFFTTNGNWTCHNSLWERYVRKPDLHAQFAFSFWFIDVTKPVCLASVIWIEKLAQASILPMNEASLAWLLLLQKNKEKIDGFLNFK